MPKLLHILRSSLSLLLISMIEYQMDHFAVTEEQIATQRLRQKLDEVNEAAQTHLAPIQDHVNFTLQGIVCPLDMGLIPFGILRLSLPERLHRSLMVCQDKYEAAKLQQKPGAVNDLLSCADLSIQDGIKMLPLLTNKFKASFGIRDNSPS
ncbi:hypothetical protein RIF29_25442 [Crotalaria pallida]|uniref:Secreted protein n=1 Tax=Crotalaria pallida TaxID=3830 RepID=A0AAN9EM62_CROPI